ncbi:unnamed protein product [Discosporangium mesarthrocarpum]
MDMPTIGSDLGPLARQAGDLGTRILSAEAHEGEDTGQHDVMDQGVGALVFALAIGVVCRSYLRSIIPLPYTVQVLMVGVGVGMILEYGGGDSLGRDLGISLDQIRFMNPEIVFYALLPILIFESAFFTDVHIFLRELWQVLVLAGPGVVIATFLTAVFAKYAFPYSWDWNTALYFGAMTSATDPVAVVSLLKELGVSERLSVLIEGESLLNDGTSIVLFSVFFNEAAGEAQTGPGTVLQQFFRLGLGGTAVGLGVGAIGAFVVGYILEDHLSEITCTVVVCFSAFLIAEATVLKVSGVLAIVFGGLYMSFYGRPRISPSVQEPLHSFWSLWGYMANTAIFFIAGLEVAQEALGKDTPITWEDWGYLLLLYGVVHVVRALNMATFYPVLKRGYGTDWSQLVVLTYAGLRGAVGLTLALIVQENNAIPKEIADKVIFHMAGLALLTLLINATTIGRLMHLFQMDRATKAQTEVFIRACSAVEAKLEHVVEHLKKDRFLGDSDWPIVWRYIPVMTSRVYWHRISYGNVVLANGEEEEIQAGGGETWQGNLSTGEDSAARSSSLTLTQWAMSAGEGGPGGLRAAHSRFAHLPPRLRNTWQRYHRMFQVTEEVQEEGLDQVIEGNISGEAGNEYYRALDNTVHMPKSGTASV